MDVCSIPLMNPTRTRLDTLPRLLLRADKRLHHTRLLRLGPDRLKDGGNMPTAGHGHLHLPDHHQHRFASST